jgi:hypothetical protein
MEAPRYFPPKDEVIKVLSLTVLIIVLSEFFEVPTRSIERQFPGLYINFTLSKTHLVSLFVTGVLCTGLIPIFRAHPKSGDQPIVIHWFLPVLVAGSTIILLEQIPEGFLRYIYILLGVSFLAVVIYAEYITLDAQDRFFLPASITIQGVANGAFIIVTAALQNVETRLFYLLPVVILSNLAFSFRVLILQIEPGKAFFPAVLYSLIVGEVAAAIHYLPIRPIQYGLMLVGVSYCLLLFINPLFIKPRKTIGRYVEGFVVLALIWGIAIFLL